MKTWFIHDLTDAKKQDEESRCAVAKKSESAGGGLCWCIPSRCRGLHTCTVFTHVLLDYYSTCAAFYCTTVQRGISSTASSHFIMLQRKYAALAPIFVSKLDVRSPPIEVQ